MVGVVDLLDKVVVNSVVGGEGEGVGKSNLAVSTEVRGGGIFVLR